MAENNTNRPLGLNLPAAPGVRRSNLRLAFPNQTRSPNNDRPQNDLEFPASGYPTSQMDNSRAPQSVFSRFMATKAESSGSSGAVGISRVGSFSRTEDDHLYNSAAARSGNTAMNRIGSAPAALVATSSLTSSMPRPSSLTSSMRPGSLKISNQQQNGQQISSQPKERQKKQLVLVLPPSHNNHQNSSSRDHNNHTPNHQNPNHQNHNHQHNRNLFHPDTFRDRSHKSAMNDTSNESPPRERVSRGMYQSIQSSGKLQITPELQVEFTADDLTDLGEIGRGGFGTVNKMVHRKSNTIMAVKRIRSTVDEKEQKQLLMDLEVVMRSNDCPCIVMFYGAIFKEGDCWICMELMDTSLDKFYKFIYERLSERLPENILGKITVATLIALNYLKEKLKIIHRDVKPSNILLDKRGNIKLCDFGISGQLVDSIAKTRDAGCRPYMAPERIDPARARGYDVRSDVWSLGITLMELATGYFPYPKWNSVFEQLTQVVQGEPPRLSKNENGNTFSEEFVCFVNTCLIKEESSRPKYRMLLEHEFVTRSKADPVDVAEFVSNIMDKMANNGRNIYTYDSYNC